MSTERGESAWPPEAIHILRYLTRHPEASDTLEGVAEWWVMRETIEHGVEETARALDFLVSRDLLIEDREVEDRPRYRLNRKRMEDIRELMETLDRATP